MTTEASEALTELDLAIVAIEKQRWRFGGAKVATIQETLGWSETRYYQVLNAMLDRPEVERAEPALVHRLRRIRERRAAARRWGSAGHVAQG